MNRLIDYFGVSESEFFGRANKDSWKFGVNAPSERLAFGFSLRPETSKVETSIFVSRNRKLITVELQPVRPLIGFVFKVEDEIIAITTDPFKSLRFQDTNDGIKLSISNSHNEPLMLGLNEEQSAVVGNTLITDAMVVRSALIAQTEADFQRVYHQK